MHTAFQEKPTDWAVKPPALCSLPPELMILIKSFLELYFHQWAETCPIPTELYSYILICIFTD